MLAYKLWGLCNHQRGHTIGLSGASLNQLSIVDIVSLCEAYNATTIDFEKVLYIERIVYPIIARIFASQK